MLRRSIGRALLQLYKGYARRRSDTSLEHALQVARQTISRTSYAFLITNGQGPAPSARLIEPLYDLERWNFFVGTDPRLRKVAEVRANPAVTLAFGHQREQANVVVYGRATLLESIPEKRRWWKGAWRLFFPAGPASPEYVVLRIEPERMEVLSFGRHVIPEPFGLRPVALERVDGAWRLAE